MAELNNRQRLLASRPIGMVKETDFRWSEAIVPSLKEGEVLLRNLVLLPRPPSQAPSDNSPMNIGLYAKCRTYIDPDAPEDGQIAAAEVQVSGKYDGNPTGG
jgi:hypothetical protein